METQIWFYVPGSWYQGKRNGEGQYTYANGDIYKGGWKDNLKDGTGTYHFKASMSQVRLLVHIYQTKVSVS